MMENEVVADDLTVLFGKSGWIGFEFAPHGRRSTVVYSPALAVFILREYGGVKLRGVYR